MSNIKLTANFTLSEFLVKGGYNADTIVKLPTTYLYIQLMANRLQVLRDILGKPIKINSAVRNVVNNRRVGGVSNSYHLPFEINPSRFIGSGSAVDLALDKDEQKFLKLENWSGGYGKGNTFCHLDLRPSKSRWSY